jgi:DUF4097 and DUF4098 domain-containing protein YvlB
MELNAVNGDVDVTNVEGELAVGCVNGDLHLSRVRCSTVEASTVSGAIVYTGDVRTDGRYHFATHSGDIAIAIPDKASLSVSVATYSGDFDSSFPIRLSETKAGRRFKFTLGSGAGQLELESFEGTIRLVRPGEPLEGMDEDSQEHKGQGHGHGQGQGHGKDKDRDKDKDKDKDGDEDDNGDN